MNRIQFFAGILMCTLLSSCHALVSDEFPDFAPLPVMNGLLQADSTFKVQVSLTANLTDSMPVYVSEAKVIIENNVDAPDTLLYTKKGWYTSLRTAKAGVTYSCRAEIPGFPTISAQATVPVPSVIDSLVFTDLDGRDEEGARISSVEFRLINDLQAPRFWTLKFKAKGIYPEYDWDTKETTEKLVEREGYIFMKAGQDSVLLSEANPLTFFSNRKIKTSSHRIKFYFSEYNLSYSSRDTLIVELLNIDESYYKYVKQGYIYGSAGSVDIGQSAQKYPLYSNVQNGLGLFTGVSVTKMEILPLTPPSFVRR